MTTRRGSGAASHAGGCVCMPSFVHVIKLALHGTHAVSEVRVLFWSWSMHVEIRRSTNSVGPTIGGCFRRVGSLIRAIAIASVAALTLSSTRSPAAGESPAAPQVPGRLPADVRDVEVYLLAGQSNMDGRAAKACLVGEWAALARQQPDVWIRFRGGGLARPLTLSDGFRPLEPGYSGTPGNGPNALPTENFGPEIGLGTWVSQAHPGKKILLIKCAEGGTSLVKDWAPGTPGKLYEQFITFVKVTLNELDEAQVGWKLHGMAWHQGESDVGLTAGVYQSALTDLAGRVRGDLNVPDLPIAIGEITKEGDPGRMVIRVGQAAAAKAVLNCRLVETADLKTQDGTHFDAVSQLELGRRFAKALLGLSAKGL